MLMGAAHNALWAFNARVSLTLPVCHRPQAATLALRSGAVRSPVTVVPSCGLETRSWRTGRMARHKQECIRLSYAAPLASQRAFFVKVRNTPCGKGNARRSSGSGQVKIQNRNNQLCLNSTADILIYCKAGVSVLVIPSAHGQCRYVAGIVIQHLVYRLWVAPHGGGDHRVRDQTASRVSALTYSRHLPSALSAVHRLTARNASKVCCLCR